MGKKGRFVSERGGLARSVVWRGLCRRSTLVVAMAAALLAVPVGQAAMAVEMDSTVPTTRVIVSAPNAGGHAKERVKQLNGKVASDLTEADAVVADVTAGQLAELALDDSVVVTPNNPAFLADAGTTPTRPPAAVFPQSTGATKLHADGNIGRGINVAVLDTGISNLPDFAGRLVGGVDLSGEGNPFQDSYGHGTFVAGLIAGNGASSNGAYIGEAPGAGLVSIKVAGASGQTDIATVIAGVGWAIANQSRLSIGVLNISLGAMPTGSTVLNPLDRVVELAWLRGIVVVVSAGNAGPFNGTILSPGDDPLVITSGALDDQGTADTTDDTMTDFSSAGPTSADGWYKPDLVAPGRSVISVRAPGSTVDVNNPSARIGSGNFVGSGTSFSAAITSGAAALVLRSSGNGKPDTVKGRLVSSTALGPVGNPFVDGAGALDVYGAVVDWSGAKLSQSPPLLPTPPGASISLASTYAKSFWSSSAWNGTAWNGSAWNGSAWNGSAWNGSAWNGSAWNGSAWNGSAWNASFWTGAAWNGSAWNGSAWNGAAWNGSAWNGSAWNGAWNGGAWNGSAWNGSAWNGSAWNGTAWNGTAWN
ncbi:MAG: peptidase and in kexin sedolisin [Acidimicrobiales bacterium]|jgi:serine protease AprX|nr:peptidase and in kexin sedolisin [Acidimicrobiales bacterium]